MSSSPAVWEVLLRSRTEAQRFELEQTGRCWRTLVAIDGPGYHYEFGSLAIMALCHGLRLEGVADRHPAVAQVGVVMGSPVVAVPDGDGVLVQVNGVPWARGDAFEMGREFYGIERERKYFDIACERIARAQAQGQMFAPESAALPTQQAMEL